MAERSPRRLLPRWKCGYAAGFLLRSTQRGADSCAFGDGRRLEDKTIHLDQH
jgi:hypothetical protein